MHQDFKVALAVTHLAKDAAVVGEQRELQPLRLREGLVVLRAVAADAEHHGARLLEFRILVAELARLQRKRATRVLAHEGGN